MRRRSILVAGACASAVAALGLAIAAEPSPIRQPPVRLVRDGDLVFRRGTGLESAVVLSLDPESLYSHVGVLLNSAGSLEVIHAVPQSESGGGGVKREDLASFAGPDRASSIAVYRVLDLNTRQGQLMRQQAVRLVGRPFNDDYALSDETRLYCTQLAVQVISAVRPNARANLVLTSIPLAVEPVLMPGALAAWSGLVKIFDSNEAQT